MSNKTANVPIQKGKYYSIPRKILNPRAVHLYDIAAMAIVIVLALTVLPIGKILDFSVRFNEKSESYLVHETELRTKDISERWVKNTFFEDYFESTMIQNDSALCKVDDELYFYKNGEQGYSYYPYSTGDDAATSQSITCAEDTLQPGIIGSNFYLSIAEDGRIYYDDMDDLSGWTDCYIHSEATDLSAVSKLLCSGEKITLNQAALIWDLIRKGTLVGFSDNTAWFCISEDGNDHIYRGTASGLEDYYIIDGKAPQVMVAFNTFLFYKDPGGDLYAVNLKEQKTLYFPYSTDWSNFGDVIQIAYVKLNNGNIRLYSLNEITSVYADFTGVGVEMADEPTYISATTNKNYSAVMTTRTRDGITVWFRDGEQWHSMDVED